ncbi:hypothetical protein [Mycobacteroides abscessus]|uniref:hypothetical protein n=1 Tax=Mycobacteroides abscessus TaxID=36809 RepID=UPI0009C98F5E|nr:hypothetical protein [Mycobacteroides abscessus]MDM3950348.1 hypothetical protein [Mycobacteroides abscessus]SLJ17912.1 Uncharacterised protein [Mycobacteroides abscessus subsp. massiliense]
MKPGDAERMYDALVLMGLNPVPWQFTLLTQLEQQSINEQFAAIVAVPVRPSE